MGAAKKEVEAEGCHEGCAKEITQRYLAVLSFLLTMSVIHEGLEQFLVTSGDTDDIPVQISITPSPATALAAAPGRAAKLSIIVGDLTAKAKPLKAYFSANKVEQVKLQSPPVPGVHMVNLTLSQIRELDAQHTKYNIASILYDDPALTARTAQTSMTV